MLVVVFAGLGLACDKRPDTPPDRPPPQVDPPADPTKGPVGADDGASSPPSTEDRTAVVPAAHPLFARLEGDGFPNNCHADGDCFEGGCSSEVCSAERGVITTCEAFENPGWPADAGCGCVSGQCRWWSESGATLPAAKPGAGDCGGQTCTPPKECITYFGIAGANGPEFKSCEIRCKGGGKGGCPDGTSCVTIADGPGSVCR